MPRCVLSCPPQFPLLRSPGLVDCDNVTVFVFEPAQLLDELVDPVVARERASVFLNHRDCDRVVIVIFVVSKYSLSWAI